MRDPDPPTGSPGSILGPAVAGRWYPADAGALAGEVDALLDRAPAADDLIGSPIRAIVAPHAGLVYSGGVAASAFAAIRGRSVSRVLLLGTSHYEGYSGARLPAATSYRTPLGSMELDREARDALATLAPFAVDDRPFLPEHALEAEMPFLQRALDGSFRLLPVLLGGVSEGETLNEVANGLRPWIDERTLLVVSTDFTHYGRKFGYVPFEDNLGEALRALDLGAVDCLRRLDHDGFQAYVERTGATICGRTALRVLLRLLPADSLATLAGYDTSGRMTGDWSHTVSYASLVFRGPAGAAA